MKHNSLLTARCNLNSTTEPIKQRGKQKEPTLVHINVRLPQYVVDHFKSYPNYTQKIRRVLTNHVDRVRLPYPEGDENDR